jgi:TrpR-related protein YerC/YecD
MSVANSWYQKEVDELLDRILSITNREDLINLFDDILTPREINDCARRMKALEMIREGASYSQIRDKLGLADNTIAKISANVGFGFRRSFSKVGNPKVHNKRKKTKILPGYKGAPAIRI